MKKLSYFIALIAISMLYPLKAQNNNAEADAIMGTWVTGSGKAHVEIKKFNNTYYGQVVWMLQPNGADGKPKTDAKNPDASKRQNTIMGLKMLLGFVYVGNKKWEDGTIYDPENGSTYKCNIEMKDSKTLNIRGYIGISWIGRTDVWKRIK
jgi:uncharacterized protein (DUF2147 family)